MPVPTDPSPSATWAHGLPEGVRRRVTRHLGPWTPTGVTPTEPLGTVTGVARTPAGPVEVSAAPLDHPAAAALEASARLLQTVPLGPAVLFHEPSPEWTVLVIQHLGRSSGRPDPDALKHALLVLSRHPWPGAADAVPLAQRLAPYLPDGADRDLAGDCTVHTQLPWAIGRPANGPAAVRVTGWQHACPGPPWADTALTVGWLTRSGWPPEQAQAWGRRASTAYADAPGAAVALLALAAERAAAQATRSS